MSDVPDAQAILGELARDRQIKQVIAIRTDLNMRKGKIAAQVAHAAMKVFLNEIKFQEDPLHKNEYSAHLFNIDSATKFWLESSFTKVVVGVEGEEEIYELAEKSRAAGIRYAIIVDNGFTEFHGNKTTTCIAIGPAEAKMLDPITGKLKLI
jgi:PTH2 family peptidyl-tRNA hydrolase